MHRPSDATRAALKTLTASMLLATAAGEAAADFRFLPELVVGAGYSDNVDLSGTQAADDVAALFLPRLSMVYDGPRFTTNMVYGLEHYAFMNESDRDATYHQFEGLATLEALPETFFVDAQALYSQTLADPLQPIAYSNMLNTINRADFSAKSVTPRIARNLSPFVRLEADYRMGRVDFEDIPSVTPDINLEDLEDRALRVSLGSVAAEQRLGWDLRFFDERVEFESAARVAYRSADARLAYRVSPTVQLIGSGGRESDVREDQMRASLDAPTWNAGFRWSPSTQIAVEATAGERWFGPAYEFDARFAGRRLDAGATYVETSLTVGQQLFRRPVLRPTEPTDPQGGLGRNTPEVYLSKAANAWLGLTGRRNRIELSAYDERRTFLVADQLESERGARAVWDHRLGARTTVSTEAGWQRVGYIATTRNDEFLVGTLTLRRQLGMRSDLELVGRHGRRTSDEAPSNPLYEENSAMLRFRWMLEPREDGSVDATSRAGVRENGRDR